MTDDAVVRIKKSTRGKLGRLRDATRLDSYDAAILWLLREYEVKGRTAPKVVK